MKYKVYTYKVWDKNKTIWSVGINSPLGPWWQTDERRDENTGKRRDDRAHGTTKMAIGTDGGRG